MNDLTRAKVLSVARHVAGGTGLTIGAGANLSIADFFLTMSMDRIMGLMAFIATVIIAVVSKDVDALRPYQPPPPNREG